LTGQVSDPKVAASAESVVRKVDHIEQQIRELSAAVFAELRESVMAQDWAAWDSKIEADSRSGKMDDFVAESKQEYEGGRARKL
jgi:hypothetical protein